MPRPKNKTGMPVKCQRCGYEWLTQSENFYVSCPKCHGLTKIREIKKIGENNVGESNTQR